MAIRLCFERAGEDAFPSNCRGLVNSRLSFVIYFHLIKRRNGVNTC